MTLEQALLVHCLMPRKFCVLPVYTPCQFLSLCIPLRSRHCSRRSGPTSEQRGPKSPFSWHLPSSRGRQTNNECSNPELHRRLKGDDYCGKEVEQGKRDGDGWDAGYPLISVVWGAALRR